MKIAIFQWNVLITIFSELNLNWLIHFFLIYLMPPTFQILYGDFNKFPGFKLWIKVLNVTYQMKSLQWQQNVGCLKNLGMNLWSLTSDIFFFFRAPFLARNLRNKNYVYFSIFQLLILPWCVNYLLPRHRGLVLVRVLGHAGPPLRLS